MCKRIFLVLALIGALDASAATMRLCFDERSHLPFITPEGGGLSGQLILEAAKEVGVTVEFYGAPLVRCREEIRANIASGFPTAPYTAALLPFMAFPMNGKEPDTARSMMSVRALVYRRRGSDVDWDGAHFIHLQKPVLAQFGSVLLFDRLTQMQVPFDDKGKTASANFVKLLAGRGDIAVVSEYSGAALLSQAQFAGKIEVLPVAFSDEPYYLGLSKRFYDADPALMERLWSAIGRIRKTPAYQATVQKALTDYAKTLKE